jgi:D-threo-aldose 1-dehydrogenase
MAIDPYERVRLGRTSVVVTRLGFGAAPAAGLYRAVSEADGVAAIRHAWDMGIRYFDMAPLYGYGDAETRCGIALRDEPREDLTISTKVGRLLIPTDQLTPQMDRDWQRFGDQTDAYYQGTPDVRPVFDYSGDGIRRSVEDSLERTGLGHLDILYIHDPDDHLETALREAWPALERLRAEGTVGAIGLGMNSADHLAWFCARATPDVLLVAGRYTILDQSAMSELMPRCEADGIAVVIGGVMNSGLLVDPKPGATFDYAPADQAWVEKAQRLRDVCRAHEVNLRAAAVQFVFAHPAVASVVAGVRSIAHLDEYPELMRAPIPAALWSDLRAEGLLDPTAPVPH